MEYMISVILGPTTISKHNAHDLNVNHLTPRRGNYNCVGEDWRHP